MYAIKHTTTQHLDGLLIVSIILILSGVMWSVCVSVQDARLLQRIKNEAVPSPGTVWARIRWRRPLRQFLPPLLALFGMMLLVNNARLEMMFFPKMRQELEISRLLANTLCPISAAIITFIHWHSWKRYRNDSKPHID